LTDSRKREVVLDLKNVSTERELQILLKKDLDFPEYYGENWDAFWDTITGIVELPEKVIFKNWSIFEERAPNEAKDLKRILQDFNKEYPMIQSHFFYE
jgi:ribonuclease inhibitor